MCPTYSIDNEQLTTYRLLMTYLCLEGISVLYTVDSFNRLRNIINYTGCKDDMGL